MGRTSTAAFSWEWGRRTSPAGAGPLAGVRFQEEWERAAFQAGGGGFLAPAQRVEDFLKKRPSQGPGAIRPTYRPGVTWTELDRCLPGAVADTLRGALPLMDRKLRGFAAPDGVLTGVETRSSSPVRILRDETFQSTLRGLYPCGEGGGATPAGSSPPPWTASGWPRPWPGIKNKTRCPAGSAFLLGGEKRPVIPADPYER